MHAHFGRYLYAMCDQLEHYEISHPNVKFGQFHFTAYLEAPVSSPFWLDSEQNAANLYVCIYYILSST